MRKIIVLPIKVYKIILSPLLSTYIGHSCRYDPTCSVYAAQAIEKYGFHGVILALKRILRCNWRSVNYYDPVK